MRALKQETLVWSLLGLCVCALLGLWFSMRDVQARWLNVPPPPTSFAGAAAGLGDTGFAYRYYGIILQNMGDMGGQVTSLRDYNYDHLGGWFALLDNFDRHSNFLPFLAAYYFGGLDQDTERLRPLVLYLAKAGNMPEGQKWRWLAQAVYLARFKMEDLDLALDLARKLGALGRKKPQMPAWATQMEANVLNARGDKEAAYGMLIGILENGAQEMHPNEVNATVAYICEQILTEEEAKINPVCQDIP